MSTICKYFFEQVQKTPENLAIVNNEKVITFLQLAEQVQHVASHLRALSISPGDIVGILLPRSIDAIVCMLAIQRCGAVYIPLDIRYPLKNTQGILESSKAKAVIVTSCTHFLELPHLKCIDFQDLILPINAILENDYSMPEQGAYLIYTSGSTGKPKGVLITHQNACAFLDWAKTEFNEQAKGGILASTSFCFDLSVFEIYLPLICGGTVYLVENHLSILELPKHYNINLINTVPSVAEELVKQNAIPTCVSTINLAGEQLRQTLVDQLYAVPTIKKVYNLYGPSETTTYSTCYLTQANETSHHVSIGKEITGTKIYILDKFMNIVPYQVKGEIYIAGQGVSAGYLHNNEETDKRFITHSFNEDPPIYLYKTGDIGKRLRDGNIEFLGREDAQIKIRGFRIEPAEIEKHLMTNPDITAALVIAYQSDEQKLLVAYLQIANQMDEVKIRSFLKERLPNHFIPSFFIQIDKFPLNQNGKVDYKQLPHPNVNPARVKTVEPTTQTELLLKAIWQEILDDPNVGKDDNFFEIGGHSLLAVKLFARIKTHFSKEIPLSLLFNHPTLSELAQALDDFTQQTHQLPVISAGNRGKYLPLSYAQKRTWLLDQMESGKPISNVPMVLKVKGQLDHCSLQKSIDALIARHEILRTTYAMQQLEPVQIVNNSRQCVIERILLSTQDPDEINLTLLQNAQRPFDLATDLMLRMTLFDLPNKEQILLVNQHHISSDAWSMTIFIKELNDFYNHFHSNQPLDLKSMTQYADFSVWQRQNITQVYLKNQLSYWENQLRGLPNHLLLPSDKVRPAAFTYKGAFYQFNLPKEMYEKAKIFSGKQQLTLFMFFFGCYNFLFHRYTKSQDLTLGTLSACRNQVEIEDTMGFFVNTLVIRTQIIADTTAMDYFQQLKQVILEAFANQDLPFEQLVEALSPERELSYHPLFQNLFVLQNALMGKPQLGNVEIEAIDLDRKISKFDTSMILIEENDNIRGVIEYSTDLFDESTMMHLANAYLQLINDTLDNPEKKISLLNILDSKQFNTMIYDWNKTQTDFPSAVTIPELFEQQVSLHSEKIAIIQDGTTITYQQLNQQANQLANLLKAYGVETGTCVGVMLERSIDLMVTLLAILKAGGSYVPLESSYPAQRINCMISDAALSIIVTTSECLDLISNNFIIPVCLDLERETIKEHATENIPITLSARDVAYIDYTSGSTGKPKGILSPHQGAIRLIKNSNHVAITNSDVVLQVSSIAFDMSTAEIWGALLNGAQLILLPKGMPELKMMADLITKHQVTISFLTTSLFNAFIDRYVETATTLKHLLFGGEAASHYHINLFLAQNSGCKLSNIYGATETTGYATHYPFLAPVAPDRSIFVGKPISNTTVYILDEHLQPVPVGGLGEICIGGPGVASGYLNLEELTQVKFIDHPFVNDGNEKIYRTGDLGRFNHEGELQFCGRVDNQVKVRGYRIELDEIEKAIAQISGVKDVVVLLKNDKESKLIAYLVLKDAQVTDALVYKTLQEKLPHFMLPDSLCILDAFPLNNSGKVDRNVLMQKSTIKPSAINETLIKKTALENIVLQAWQTALEVSDDISLEVNFFEMGGNSLKLVYLLDVLQNALIEKKYNKELTIVNLFEYTTIKNLAAFIAFDADSTLDKADSYAKKRQSNQRRNRVTATTITSEQ